MTSTAPPTATSAAGLAAVRAEIARACKDASRDPAEVTLVAVSKIFPPEAIEPVIAAGQRVFGENRVQEAKAKWPALMQRHVGIELHLIGPLQSNKAKEAVALFTAIHSVDRPSLCEALAKEIEKQKRKPLLFVEINTGAEAQKAGVLPQDADAFLGNAATLRPDHFRADVHSAARRGAGAAFRAHRQNRAAQWAQALVDGHERGFCDRDSARRHPCAGGQRDFRGAASKVAAPARGRYRGQRNRCGGGGNGELASNGFFSRLERKASPRGEGGTGIGTVGACGSTGCNGAASEDEL